MKSIFVFLLISILLFGCGSDDDDDASDGPLPVDDDDDDESTTDDDDSVDDDDDSDDDDDDTFLPADMPGPYHVGVSFFQYNTGTKDRVLPGIVWYPTEQTTGDPVRYFLNLLGDPVAFMNPVPSLGGPFPLIVFSHGNQSFSAQSFSFIDFLVSHGYVVAACDHLQNTALTYWTPRYFAKIALDRPQDISALIDYMLAQNADKASPLFGTMDSERIGMFGHSYGGYTTIASLGASVNVFNMVDKCEELGEENWNGEWYRCEDLMNSDLSYAEDCRPCNLGDPRIKVAVPMAPAFPYLIAPGGLEDIDVPVLIMAGDLDEISPSQSQNHLYFEGLTHLETLFWEMAGASHYTFSTACEIPILRAFFTCGPEYIEPEIATPLIQTALTAFYGLHLLGNENYRYYFQEEYLATAPEISLEKK